MVFVDKTLDQMLEEIGFANPEKHENYLPSELDRTKSYQLTVLKSTPKNRTDMAWANFVNGMYGEVSEEVLRWFYISPRHQVVDNSLSGFIDNACEYGEGVREIRYYFAPRGAVIKIIQNKVWDPKHRKMILDKVKKGLYPSSCEEKKDESDYIDGGGGFMEARVDNYEISFTDNSTLFMMKRDAVIFTVLDFYKMGDIYKERFEELGWL